MGGCLYVILRQIIRNGEVKIMNLKKLISWLLVLVLILATVAGCKVPEPTAIELVPQGADLIAVIQVSKIINDRDLRDAYDEAEKEPG